jgi:hypothetical protein
MSAPDPIELLSRIAPVSDEDAAALFAPAGRERLLRTITRFPPAPPRAARRRVQRPLVLAVALLVAIATATVAWAITRGGASETTSVECVIAGTDTVIDATSGNPAADCAAEWRRELGTPPPPLTAYANTSGGVTVLPRSQTPPARWRTLRAQNVALIELQESLDDYLNGLNSRCFDTSAARAFTRHQLDRLGFVGWKVDLHSAPQGSGPPLCTGSGIVEANTATVGLISYHSGKPPRNWLPGRLTTRLRPLTRTCLPLPAMRHAVEQRASQLGLLPEPAPTKASYVLDTSQNDKLRCTSLYETVGGTINLILRGPTH